jgi:hypothetical protein
VLQMCLLLWTTCATMQGEIKAVRVGLPQGGTGVGCLTCATLQGGIKGFWGGGAGGLPGGVTCATVQGEINRVEGGGVPHASS